MTGDFNGDGRTDIIVWSDTPSGNKLYTSNGDGRFSLASAFNITSDNLFKSDGCYYAIAADFNGDGVTDILRVMRTSSTDGKNRARLRIDNDGSLPRPGAAGPGAAQGRPHQPTALSERRRLRATLALRRLDDAAYAHWRLTQDLGQPRWYMMTVQLDRSGRYSVEF